MSTNMTHDMMDDLMFKMCENKHRQESIDAYKKELDSGVKPESSTSQPAFDPEPVMTLSPEKKKEAAMRQMIYDMKGVNW